MIGTKSAYTKRIEKLFVSAREKTYPKNQLIQYQGDLLTHVYLIKSGYVKVYTILDSGDMRTLLILGPGDIFPLMYSFDASWRNYQLRYFYQSLTDTQLKILQALDLRRKIDTDKDIKNLYIEYLVSTNHAIMNQLEIMKSKKAINKIMLLLPYLITKLGQRIKPNVYQLKVKLSHQELADLSGVTRETTTTLIKKLEKSGKIKQKGGKMVIKTDSDDEDRFSKHST
jgi:CRP-like cAMP-binding protein